MGRGSGRGTGRGEMGGGGANEDEGGGASSVLHQGQLPLLRYNKAMLLTKKDQFDDKLKQSELPPPPAAGAKKGQASAAAAAAVVATIAPARRFDEGGLGWVQYISTAPATTSEVRALQAEMDKRLQQQAARETGLCPVREELYAQCFDELIRQEAVICAERGAALLRCRDDLRMTINAHLQNYKSGLAYGVRKTLEAGGVEEDLALRLEDLERANARLRNEADDLRVRAAGGAESALASKEALLVQWAAELEGLEAERAESREAMSKVRSDVPP